MTKEKKQTYEQRNAERLAQAMRANLLKRKQQKRERASPSPSAPSYKES
tara:strand:- start:111 stop:257 length:147 start_codon:yes stop_codon:yes gene_type:complete